MGSGFLPRVERTGTLHLAPRLKISGAKPLLPPYVFSSVTLRAHISGVLCGAGVGVGADVTLCLWRSSPWRLKDHLMTLRVPETQSLRTDC